VNWTENSFKEVKPLSIIIALFSIVFITRLPSLWIHILDHDEAAYAIYANMFRLGYLPYEDFIFKKPLGLIVLWAGLFKLAGGANLLVVHAFTILIVTMTCWWILKIARLVEAPRAGLFAAFAYAFYSAVYTPKILESSIEITINLPLALGFYYFILAQKKTTLKYLFVAGFWVGLSCCFSYQAGILGILLALFWIWQPLKNLIRIKGCCLLIIGALVPLGTMMAYIIAKGVLDPFLHWGFFRNLSYANSEGFELDTLVRIGVRLGAFILLSLPLWILSLKFFLSSREKVWDQKVLLGWLVAITFPIMAGWRFYGHYFILWYPALSLLAGIELHRCWDQIGIKKKRAVVWSTVGLAVLCLLPRLQLDKVNQFTGEDNPYEYIPIAQAIVERTHEEDRIFVWGSGPHIYYFANRLPSSRFSGWTTALFGQSGWNKPIENLSQEQTDPYAWKLLMEDLHNQPPAYVVDLAPTGFHDANHSPIENFESFHRFLEEHYVIDSIVNMAVLYRHKNGGNKNRLRGG